MVWLPQNEKKTYPLKIRPQMWPFWAWSWPWLKIKPQMWPFWPWQWPWLWIFRVKYWISYISENGLISLKCKTYLLNIRHQIWPWIFSLRMTLTLNFRSEIFLIYYISLEKRSDWHGSKNKTYRLTINFELRPSSYMTGSVRPSVRPSHLFHHVPIIVSSWNFQDLLPMTKVTPMQKVKVRGQRSRSWQRSTPNLTVSGL